MSTRAQDREEDAAYYAAERAARAWADLPYADKRELIDDTRGRYWGQCGYSLKTFVREEIAAVLS